MKKTNKNSHFVYSTNPNYEPEQDEQNDFIPGQQELKLFPDKKNRNGKVVTVVSGFRGSEADLKDLEKQLKSQCGAGGTSKDGNILIQGQFIDKIAAYLKKKGHRVKISGV